MQWTENRFGLLDGEISVREGIVISCGAFKHMHRLFRIFGWLGFTGGMLFKETFKVSVQDSGEILCILNQTKLMYNAYFVLHVVIFQ